LGFVHTGHDRSFVFDVADLYKMELAVPTAFGVVAKGSEDIGGDVRRAMRDAMYNTRLMSRCVEDVHRLLGSDGEQDSDFTCDVIELWDTRSRVAGGQNYSDEVPW
jgi:CRISPR-associated protein Cas1